ncbi:tetraspanin family protein [Lolliginicoccus suaedae]|uniref:tetraspanin family protein n=1 Tax=Lolliginicoccus suaedae TaxID=2605429 RepID=UPI0011ECF5D9|nr:tetraspanin family protein [Lolliginicoccus suaedae]
MNEHQTRTPRRARFSPALLLAGVTVIGLAVWAMIDPTSGAGPLALIPWLLISIAILVGLILIIAPNGTSKDNPPPG